MYLAVQQNLPLEDKCVFSNLLEISNINYNPIPDRLFMFSHSVVDVKDIECLEFPPQDLSSIGFHLHSLPKRRILHLALIDDGNTGSFCCQEGLISSHDLTLFFLGLEEDYEIIVALLSSCCASALALTMEQSLTKTVFITTTLADYVAHSLAPTVFPFHTKPYLTSNCSLTVSTCTRLIFSWCWFAVNSTGKTLIDFVGTFQSDFGPGIFGADSLFELTLSTLYPAQLIHPDLQKIEFGKQFDGVNRIEKFPEAPSIENAVQSSSSVYYISLPQEHSLLKHQDKEIDEYSPNSSDIRITLKYIMQKMQQVNSQLKWTCDDTKVKPDLDGSYSRKISLLNVFFQRDLKMKDRDAILFCGIFSAIYGIQEKDFYSIICNLRFKLTQFNGRKKFFFLDLEKEVNPN